MKKIKFRIPINNKEKLNDTYVCTLIDVVGVRTFTLQGESFIVHRSYVDGGTFSKQCWNVSHFNTGLGAGINKQTIEKAIQRFKGQVKGYKANLKGIVCTRIKINPDTLFPCLKCQLFKLTTNSMYSRCGNSNKQPHLRKKICKQFKERSCK